MTSGFEVVSVVFSDYVTQDASGKAIQVGISYGELRFSTVPQYWQPVFVTLTLKPLQKKFRFYVDFDAPDERRILRLTAACEFLTEIPANHVVSTNLQTPAVPFPGPGTYVVKIRDESKRTVFRHAVEVVIGPPIQSEFTFDGQVQIGEAFANGASA